MDGRKLGGDMEGSWVEIGVEGRKRVNERIFVNRQAFPLPAPSVQAAPSIQAAPFQRGWPRVFSVDAKAFKRPAERLSINVKYPRPPSLERGCLN